MKTKAILSVLCVALVCVFTTRSAWSEIETGQKASDFTLTAYDGSTVSLSEFKGKYVVLEWFNPECPFVKKHYREGAMQELQSAYADKGVKWIAINSTHEGHNNYYDSAKMAKKVDEWKISNATVVKDASGAVGASYSAKTTPHMFIIDPEGKVAYQGAIDDESGVFANPRESKNYVKEALDALLGGKPVETASTKPYGCSVKYAN